MELVGQTEYIKVQIKRDQRAFHRFYKNKLLFEKKVTQYGRPSENKEAT